MVKLSKLDHFKVISLFIVLTIVLTYPLILNMNNITGVDDYVFVHSFWWFKKALFSFNNPFFTDYIFYPEGTSIAFHSTTFSNSLLTLPVSILFGVNVAVNTAFILTFIFSGYITFLLAFELTGSKPASIIAGIVFAFNPFHFFQGRSHLHISTLQWIPLFFLFFKRAMEREEVKWSIFAGITFGVIVLTDQMQTICAFMIVALAALILLAKTIICKYNDSVGNEPSWQISTKRLFIIMAIAGITSSIYLYEALRELRLHPLTTKIDPMAHGGANTFSGDLMGFIIPSPSHPIWGKFFASYHPGLENTLYFGYMSLLLALIGALTSFRKGIVKYIFAVTILFWILSLGTYLHVNGVWEWSGASYALPFLYLTKLPIIGDIRTPCRFHMITILGTSILAAYGIAEIIKRLKGVNNKIWTLIAITGVILVEILPSPPSVDATKVAALYMEMAKDKETYTVLQLPLARWSANARNGIGNPAAFMYLQTVHGKRFFGGHVSRLPMESLDFKDPLLDLFSEISTKDNFRIGRKLGDPTEAEVLQVRKMSSELSKGSEEFFKRYNIRYVVLHAPISWKKTLSRAFVEGFTGKSLIDVPNDNIAYIKVQ